MSGPASASGEGRDVLVIFNASATASEPRALDASVEELERGFGVEIASTESAADAREASAAAAAAGVAIVAAFGGDGTARSVAEGLSGSSTALACLPAGSRNVFARMIGVPRDPRLAARRLAAGSARRRRIDLGTVAGRPFLFAASIGLSARANEQLNRHPRVKARFGAAYATAAAIGVGASYLLRPPRLRLRAHGRSLEAVSMVVQNARPLTYVGERPVELCERVSLTSGTVSIAALRRLGLREMAALPGRILLERTESAIRHRSVEEVEGVREASVVSMGARELPLDLDGDHMGRLHELDVGVAPGALVVMAGR